MRISVTQHDDIDIKVSDDYDEWMKIAQESIEEVYHLEDAIDYEEEAGLWNADGSFID